MLNVNIVRQTKRYTISNSKYCLPGGKYGTCLNPEIRVNITRKLNH